MADTPDPIEARFLAELRHHIQGWKAKITADFSQSAYQSEFDDLCNDSLYRRFAFNHPAYVLIRLMGRMSISIGRRLGEIYDKVPRFVVQGRFELTAEEIAPKVHDELNLDICIPYRSARLAKRDAVHIVKCVTDHLGVRTAKASGLGIEIRYNFNPNDSARLRKDVKMAEYLIADGFCPIYLIFSSISPRDEAIQRLERAGWKFLVGDNAIDFMKDLVEMDFETILDRPLVKKEIADEVAGMMKEIMSSHAFTEAVKDMYHPAKP